MSNDNEEYKDIKWALDLLTPDPNESDCLLSKYNTYWGTGIMAIGGVASTNWALKRTFFSNAYLYPVSFAVAMVVSYFVTKRTEYRYGLRDAALRQYIKAYPEDFKNPSRTLYKDLFDTWVPLR